MAGEEHAVPGAGRHAVAGHGPVSAVEELEVARCREMLGDEAIDLSDREVLRIRDSAEAIARVIVQIHDSERGQR